MTEKKMQLKEKQEVERAGEPTRPERYYVPSVDIYETQDAVTILAEMPGVGKEGVEIDLEDGTLTIKGFRTDQKNEGETMLLQEFESGSYMRKFSVAETIDQGKIEAKMADGILTLVLPKVEPAKPRKIEVKGS
jgi:HSP20 family protein